MIDPLQQEVSKRQNATLRLECLKLADARVNGNEAKANAVIQIAEKYYAFVKGITSESTTL